ncbi:hypothetical protein HNQ59_003905 [Chitinivorax tropicus]|uniref:RapA2 cadherin-like domain-containing protein n=1 Tax=Chitinivorax tropicus TaxID=714531 RepID=A0A840MN72_9PROT|nr:Ig-like domain-containing protein [Chitinivorax tropicus]MBB5020584.1 hypothetical protein [Chitinivorax tropicus]
MAQPLVVTLLPVNDTPTALNQQFTVAGHGSQRIDFSQLIGDVDGQSLSLHFDGPCHGTLQRQPDGSYIYRPHPVWHAAGSRPQSLAEQTGLVVRFKQ